MAAITFPTSPANGDVYDDSANGVAYVYVQSINSWTTQLASASTNASANPGSTPPLNPTLGTLWLDTDTNIMYVYLSVNGAMEWQATAGSGSTSNLTGLGLEGSATYDGIELTDVGIYLETSPET